jgi:hypothetical protein
MRTMKTSNREIGNLALIVALTIGVALLAVCINITDRVYGFLNFYSKLDNFQLYANVVLLYLAGLIWLIAGRL